MKEQRILGINTEFRTINYPNYYEKRITSSIAYFDYDAVVIDSSYLTSEYATDIPGVYKNKRLLSQDASCKIVSDFALIREQLKEVLKQGKNVFVLLGTNESCFVYTGEKQYSGTGKNARQTNIVNEFDTYSFLPFKVSVTHLYGESMEICCNSPYKDFFEKISDDFYYAAFFSNKTGKELVRIKGSTNIISSVVDYEKGKVIFLPKPYCRDNFYEEAEWEEYGKKYLDALFELDERLGVSIDDFSLPQWAEELSILNQEEEQKTLEKYELQLKEITNKIEKQKEVLFNISKYKTMLTETGTQLENIVIQVIKELGFTLCETERGRSDVIAMFEKTDVVIEIKGVSKSAAEKHAAQLEKWVSQFMEEKGRQPKAILIVNGFCQKPLSERNEDVFPAQMLKYCEARGHALISTVQLLCMYIETKTNPTCSKERIQELLSTTGVYNRYNNFDEFLISSSSKE